MGFLGRLLGKTPPKIPAEAAVLLEDVQVLGKFAASWAYRPYWVMMDANHQEVGDRHYLTRQTFSDAIYANAYCTWVHSGGKVPLPDYPDGAV